MVNEGRIVGFSLAGRKVRPLTPNMHPSKIELLWDYLTQSKEQYFLHRVYI